MFLKLESVTKEYQTQRRFRSSSITAVDTVSLNIEKGERVGLVGESGSGKSTLAKLITKFESITKGEIFINGYSVHKGDLSELELYKKVQLVFQDSSFSLSPRMSVKALIEEPLRNFFKLNKEEREKKCFSLIQKVGLDETFLERYPGELSGGQKQRVCIARAIAVEPELIIFDESLASLDQPAQMSIINMLLDLQKEKGLAYLFITHDLASAKKLCEGIAVMYKGKIVEVVKDWKTDPFTHPYAKLLFHKNEVKTIFL
jgi:ABC-type dipeptide/oligopeptide/nickel transport system ATPase subunit